MARKEIEESAAALAEPLLQGLGLLLLDVAWQKENGRRFLRFVIDRPGGGVSMEECERFSRAIDPRLDELELIDEPYYLEVASPGLDRVLRNEREFDFFRGRTVQVRCFEPLEGARSHVGRLEGLEGEDVLLRVQGEEGERLLRLPRAKVARVQLKEES
ncbi:MAG: ribosome maturation factor RimP [Bacillota bacterium]|nr:ribosome maturation factor RimP [Bacillota bacterium]